MIEMYLFRTIPSRIPQYHHLLFTLVAIAQNLANAAIIDYAFIKDQIMNALPKDARCVGFSNDAYRNMTLQELLFEVENLKVQRFYIRELFLREAVKVMVDRDKFHYMYELLDDIEMKLRAYKNAIVIQNEWDKWLFDAPIWTKACYWVCHEELKLFEKRKMFLEEGLKQHKRRIGKLLEWVDEIRDVQDKVEELELEKDKMLHVMEKYNHDDAVMVETTTMKEIMKFRRFYFTTLPTFSIQP